MTNSIDTFAPESERMRKMPSRISGAFERSSITTNAASRATATTNRPSVAAGRPAVLLRLDDLVDEHQQPGGHRRRAGDVDGLGPLLGARVRR